MHFATLVCYFIGCHKRPAGKLGSQPDRAGCLDDLVIDEVKCEPSFVVPADAIIFNSNGMQVAVVNDSKADIRKVRVTRDFGTRIEVETGIKAGDQVILNPPVNLVHGSRVQVRPTEAVATN